jgi:hypothetical protein
MTDISALLDVPVRYDLAESTCPPLALTDITDLAALRDVPLGYGTSRGDAGVRALIAADTGVGAGDVLLTIGAAQALALLAQVTCAPGDHLLLATPCFPPARDTPEAFGARVEALPLSFDDGYRLPLDRLAAALRPETRLVSLASPQNPSGVRFTEAELRELIATVDRLAPYAVVLVDETYRASAYGEALVPRSVAALSPRLVTCSSLSKSHGAPGLRIGWLTCTGAQLYERLRAAKFRGTVACSTVDEFLAGEVLRRQDEILAPRAARLGQALDEVLRWAAGQPVDIVRPDGGALCCLRLRDIEAADFHARLAERETRVAPGPWFGESDRVFRVGFGHLPPADLTEALDRLTAALKN